LIPILINEVKNLKKNLAFLEEKNTDLENELYPRRFKMGRSTGASFEVVTGNLVEEFKWDPI
jgi:hypothetical protein